MIKLSKKAVYNRFLATFSRFFNFEKNINISLFTYNSNNCSIYTMTPYDYFNKFSTPAQRRYEALKSFYFDGLGANDTASKFGFTPGYFKKVRLEFSQQLRTGADPFFSFTKTGPKKRSTSDELAEKMIALRKKNHSILDIKAILEAEGNKISVNTVDNILKTEGFAPLPKRTRSERINAALPSILRAPQSESFELIDEDFITDYAAGPLVFLPLLENLGIIEAIKKAGFPETSSLDSIQSILSFLALKLMGGLRWSYDTKWNMDRALGLFANLNVLPKATTLSTYSYRVTRSQNRNFLAELARIFRNDEQEEGEFNLDFKAIPHWGESSVLEKNWAGSRSRAMKSILALIAQDPSTGNLSYTNAEIKHRNESDAVLDFVDFWKTGRGVTPKMLIFDSKFTTYGNLNKLNQSKEQIKFLTIRRRCKSLIEEAEKKHESEWQIINVERSKNKKQKMRVHDGRCTLKGYEGEVRQIILTEHGRLQPTFLITNDFELSVGKIIKKYAARWLVEKEIAEQVIFFSLNNPSSSIVVKVDFDLTLSLLAHNLYRVLANSLPGFEHCTAATISRKFLETGAQIKVENKEIVVSLKKKTHLPILFEAPWMLKSNSLSWLGAKIRFKQGTAS